MRIQLAAWIEMCMVQGGCLVRFHLLHKISLTFWWICFFIYLFRRDRSVHYLIPRGMTRAVYWRWAFHKILQTSLVQKLMSPMLLPSSLCWLLWPQQLYWGMILQSVGKPLSPDSYHALLLFAAFWTLSSSPTHSLKRLEMMSWCTCKPLLYSLSPSSNISLHAWSPGEISIYLD